jgi:GNAT superfamily N-acetyltransferase
MNDALTIRPAKRTDAAALAFLSGELGYPTTTAEMETRFDVLVRDSRHGIYVAERDSIAGWVHVALVQSLESVAYAEICGLVVAESYRSSGIGTQLVAAAENWALQHGYHRIRVRTNVVREQTRMFYKKRGFQLKKTQEVFDKTL